MKLNPGFRKLIMLAPEEARVPESFEMNRIRCDERRYEELLSEAQQLRGSIYLEDGAVDSSQLTGGRHIVESDRKSWHLLVLDGFNRICGCVRYRQHQPKARFSDLIAARSALALCSVWGRRVRAAIDDELLLSRTLGLPFVEIGGWALEAEIRGTVEALRMVLAAYAFSREFGGAVGLATATVRHSSASILRRIGGQPLECRGEQAPAYTDRHYNCSMELLRFYSWALNPRYDVWLDEISQEMRRIPVISRLAPKVAVPQVKADLPPIVARLRLAYEAAWQSSPGPAGQTVAPCL